MRKSGTRIYGDFFAPSRQSDYRTIGAQDTRSWNDAPAKLTVKVLRLEASDEAAAVEPNLPDQAGVKIEERS